MSSKTKPEPKKFYKYMTADVAISTLENETLRWSSPFCFNDPFDVPRELAEGLKYTDISTAMSQAIEKCIRNPEARISKYNKRVKDTIIDARKLDPRSRDLYIKDKIIRDHAEKPLNLRKAAEENFEQGRQSFRERLPKMRILCLSAEKEIVPMWYYYSDKYRGVALEFDSSIASAPNGSDLKIRKVNYPKSSPEIFTAKGWAEIFMLNSEKGYEKFNNSYLYTKKPDWKYEKEYRTMFLEPKSISLYSDVKFSKACISKVYFGPDIKSQDREYLLKLISGKFQHVKAYDVKFEYGWKIKFDSV